jgi:short-subunit dehydrogenase
MQKVVLITGASAGIGLATAVQLMNEGACVYGASRRGGISKKAENGEGKMIQVELDINDEVAIAQLVARILKEQNQLDVVICNAGNGIAGSIEDSAIEEIRYQFETSFFGTVKTIQACLPTFRAQGRGQIITLSSVAGVIPIPYQAFYSSVKSALLVFMQSLSMEVKPFGIQCCTVLPGDTKTEFTAARKYTEQSSSLQSPYLERMQKGVRKMEIDEQNGMKPEVIARNIVAQVNSNCMKAIVVPGVDYKFFCFLFKVLPTKTKLWIISKIY